MSLYLENSIKIIPNIDWLNFHYTNKEIITLINLYNIRRNLNENGKWICRLVSINELFEIPTFKSIYYFKIDNNNYVKKKFKKNKIKISHDDDKFFGIFTNNKNFKKNLYKYKVYIYQLV